jgi:uncharacterized membrane protein YbhN (UPF0104 family)
MPGAPAGRTTRHRAIAGAVVAAVAILLVYVGLPAVAGLGTTWQRIRGGSPGWLLAGCALELCSYAGYVVLVRRLLVRGVVRFGWRESIEVTLAGVAATRLLATAGAGGVALTVWAMRAAGMPKRIVVVRMTSFMVVLYGVFMCALVGGGALLVLGSRDDVPAALSVVPGVFGLVVIVVALSLALLRDPAAPAPPAEGRIVAARRRAARASRLVAAGVRDALAIAASGDVALLGAVAWWVFDIAVLWCAFNAFGNPPGLGILVMGYFVGQLANTLPLPGGIGGVDAGMVGAFLGYGVDPGLAVVAVFAYRALSFWLPTAPGVLAYLRLRRDVAAWRGS